MPPRFDADAAFADVFSPLPAIHAAAIMSLLMLSCYA